MKLALNVAYSANVLQLRLFEVLSIPQHIQRMVEILTTFLP
jgi:hypothetical protein